MESRSACWTNSRDRVEFSTDLRLSRYFGTSERFWLNLQARHDLEVKKDRLGARLQRDVKVLAPAGGAGAEPQARATSRCARGSGGAKGLEHRCWSTASIGLCGIRMPSYFLSWRWIRSRWSDSIMLALWESGPGGFHVRGSGPQP
jgi:hypothetical protein